MDKIRQAYLKIYKLPKGTGIFFSNDDQNDQVLKMLEKFDVYKGLFLDRQNRF